MDTCKKALQNIQAWYLSTIEPLIASWSNVTYFPEIFFSVVSKQYFELQSSRMVITKMRALRIQTNTPMNEGRCHDPVAQVKLLILLITQHFHPGHFSNGQQSAMLNQCSLCLRVHWKVALQYSKGKISNWTCRMVMSRGVLRRIDRICKV